METLCVFIPEPWHCIQLHYAQDASRGMLWQFETLIYSHYRNNYVFFSIDHFYPCLHWCKLVSVVAHHDCLHQGQWMWMGYGFLSPYAGPQSRQRGIQFLYCVDQGKLDHHQVYQTSSLRFPKKQVFDSDHLRISMLPPGSLALLHCSKSSWTQRLPSPCTPLCHSMR